MHSIKCLARESRAVRERVMPIRIQLKRTKGWRKPDNTIAVTRPGKWGNPFKGDGCVADFRKLMNGKMSVAEFEKKKSQPFVHSWDHRYRHAELSELAGKNLACWCKSDAECHADVLLELANKP